MKKTQRIPAKKVAAVVRLPQRERDVQRDVVRLYESLGCAIYSTSQPRKAKYITPGIPDLMVFAPKVGRFWLHEIKSEKGKPSSAQLDFETLCGSCGVGHVIGGVDAAKNHLRAIGLIARAA